MSAQGDYSVNREPPRTLSGRERLTIHMNKAWLVFLIPTLFAACAPGNANMKPTEPIRFEPELGFETKGAALYRWGARGSGYTGEFGYYRIAFEPKGPDHLEFHLYYTFSAMGSTRGTITGIIPNRGRLPITVTTKDGKKIRFLKISRENVTIGFPDYGPDSTIRYDRHFRCAVPWLAPHKAEDRTCAGMHIKNFGPRTRKQLKERPCPAGWRSLSTDYHKKLSFTEALGLSHYSPSRWPNAFWLQNKRTGKFRYKRAGELNTAIYKEPILLCVRNTSSAPPRRESSP